MHKVISPVFLLLLGTLSFEFFVRFPYVVGSLNSQNMGALRHSHFFSIYPPASVMVFGMTLVFFALVVVLFAGLLTRPVYQVSDQAMSLPKVSSRVYIIGAGMVLAFVLTVLLVGPQILLEAFSSKRSELGDRGLLWVLLKVCVFSHLVACMFYIRMVQTKSRFDMMWFWLMLLILTLTTLIFSQRAILVTFALEFIYLQIILGTFKLRRNMLMLGLLVIVLVMISALRTRGEFQSIWDGGLAGLEAIVRSRYFFDFAKLGVVMQWADSVSWLGPISIGFLFEPFMADQVVFYKEIGPMISSEVYLHRHKSGVTPGGYLESLLSFGVVGGVFFFMVILIILLRIEAFLFKARVESLGVFLLVLMVVSKNSLFLNSSLGAYAFQVVLEGALLLACLPFLQSWRTQKPSPLHQMA